MDQPMAQTVKPDPRSAVTVRDLTVQFSGGRGLSALGGRRRLTVLEEVTLNIACGEVVGLAGESGSGKSTLANVLVGLAPTADGAVEIAGQNTIGLDHSGWRDVRKRVQLIFQDPFDSLNPRFSVFRTVAEPLLSNGKVDRADLRDLVLRALARAELRPAEEYASRFTSQLSGGERQRVSIARALVVDPVVLVADEPVSMLDVTTGHQIVRLLRRLANEEGVAILLIGHDLGVLGQCCDRIGIMYLGRLVEIGPASALLSHPQHPYTKALITAIPSRDPTVRRERVNLPGEPPSPARRPGGCPFHPRCAHADGACRDTVPKLLERDREHATACWHPLPSSLPP